MTAIEQWNLECAAGSRSPATWDALTRAAAFEQRDAEIAPLRAWARREELELRAKHAPAPRPPRSRVPLSQRAPALVAWAREVLAHRDAHDASIVAAAFEVSALECALAGETELAAHARAAAVDALTMRRSA